MHAEESTGTTGSAVPSGGGPSGSAAGGTIAGTRPTSGRRPTWFYVIVAVVIVVALGAAVYAATGGIHRSSGTSNSVLVDQGTLYGLPAEQWNSVVISATSPVTLNATIDNQYGVQLYQMTPQQVEKLADTFNITAAGNEWTSGPIPSMTTYYLEVKFPVGDWDLVFYNANPVNESYVGFLTPLTENLS